MISFKGAPEVKVPRFELVKLLSMIRLLSIALDQEVAAGDALVRLLLVDTMRRLLADAEELAKANKILWGTLESLPQSLEPPPLFTDSLSSYAKPWRLCRSQVSVWVGMSETPPEEVSAVSSVFEDGTGTSFLKASDAASMWTRGESKLRELREAGAEALFRRRGMGDLWDALESAHQRFGATVGMTKPRAKRGRKGASSADTAREAVDATLARYVLRVCATQDDRDEATAGRAERLLTPYLDALAALEERRVSQRKDGGDKDEAEGKADPAKGGPAKGDPTRPLQAPPATAGATVLTLRPSQRPPEPPRAATGT